MTQKTTIWGETRSSQLMYAAGVGALVDLPAFSVIIRGLNAWSEQDCAVLEEPRLLAAVQAGNAKVQTLRLPPVTSERAVYDRVQSVPGGAKVSLFPTWMVCPQCHLLQRSDVGAFTYRRNKVITSKNRFVHETCEGSGGKGSGGTAKKRTITPEVKPARYVTACKNGHLDDFPWDWFVHKGAPCPKGKPRLTLVDRGIGGDFSAVTLSCHCGVSRLMAESFGQAGKANMPKCRGYHPHLDQFQSCNQQLQTLALGGSGIWFPDMLSVLTIPQRVDDLEELVKAHLSAFQDVLTRDDLNGAVRWSGTLDAFKSKDLDRVWSLLEALRQGDGRTKGDPKSEDPPDLKGPEYDLLSQGDRKLSSVDFHAVEGRVPDRYAGWLEKVVRLERLREVNALIGFSRLEAPDRMLNETKRNRQVKLSSPLVKWAPVSENRGEGLFLLFNEEKIREWAALPQVKARNDAMLAAHKHLRRQFGYPKPSDDFPGMYVILLHSFAHALIRQMALECGYEAAGLRERIYGQPRGDAGGARTGILIYTADSDSEGTLGGLVSLGEPRRLEPLIGQALESMTLCSGDPLCSEHQPAKEGPPSVHGACCHGCLFLPETSCELGNRYLDRGVLVRTIADEVDAGFFKPDASLGNF